jgi:glutamate synthase domain-containing protein 3
LTFTGSAGQGFCAFLEPGIDVLLLGEANDSVCKSMSGGAVVIRPQPDAGFRPEESAIIGNCALYGATGGELFINGHAGDRFAVRNSGATAVVEGVGFHACEYMTGGTIVILNAVSHNVGAGMTGGTLYMRRENETFVNDRYLVAAEMGEDDYRTLQALLLRHAERSGSMTANAIVSGWDRSRTGFLRFVPLSTRPPGRTMDQKSAFGG